MKSRILVTGCNGQVGKELRRLSVDFPEFDFVFLSREDLPIHHFEVVRNSFEAWKPSFCVNCAAYTAVDRAESERELAFQVNGEAVGVLAAVCKERNCRLIHISTDYVFDGSGTRPYTETDAVNPQSVYGASKLEGERLALKLNPETVILRTSWVYSEYGKNFVKTMLKLMAEMPAISVVNDQIGSPTYAGDLAEAILRIIQNWDRYLAQGSVSGIYHFSNHGVISWWEFACEIASQSGLRIPVHPITTEQYPTPARRPAYSVLDKSKFANRFSLPVRDWKSALTDCLSRIKKAP